MDYEHDFFENMKIEFSEISPLCYNLDYNNR